MSQTNESAIQTPGVYVYEIPSFPPSIAQVATAVPAFIGYSQIATMNGKSVINQAVRISSMVEYVKYFGGAFPDLTATVVLDSSNGVLDVSISPNYQLYNSVTMFFNHGGGNCYIISVGLYPETLPVPATAAITDFINSASTTPLCFDVLRLEDEPTLIVVPDAILFNNNQFNSLATTALQQCADLGDRFAILDIPHGDTARDFSSTDVITVFRTGIGSVNLNYGAAYYPWLRSSLSYTFSYQDIILQRPAGTTITASSIISGNTFLPQLVKATSDLTIIIDPFLNTGFGGIFVGPITTVYNTIPIDASELINKTTYIKDILTGFIALNTTFTDNDTTVNSTQQIFNNYIRKGTSTTDLSPIEVLMAELILLDMSYPVTAGGIGVVNNSTTFAGYTDLSAIAAVPHTYGNPDPANETDAAMFIRTRFANLYSNVINMVLAFVKDVNTRITNLDLQLSSSSAVYGNIINAIQNQGIVVPPCGAIAGIYASVDATRGVWKAPANVSLNTVIEPLVTIDDNTQGDLNVDVSAGKSINAIRAFTGKGILVWGARTLDGNSNDFRYISVRRLYITVEESVKKAAMQFVFEPNDGNTWVRIRAMIENYLTNLWRQGALAGSKPEQAFYVKVGLGQTMTFDDILNGKMIIEIGMAPVRPAEFIILRFSQIQQQA